MGGKYTKIFWQLLSLKARIMSDLSFLLYNTNILIFNIYTNKKVIFYFKNL